MPDRLTTKELRDLPSDEFARLKAAADADAEAVAMAMNIAAQPETVPAGMATMDFEPNVTVELYARVGYTYSKSGGWSHKDATVSAKISGVPTEDSDSQTARVGEHLKTLSRLTEQRASAEIARRNQLGADGPMSEIVAGDAQGVSGED